MKIAVIDLGTNTFNLLVCEIAHSSYTILFQTKRAPKIGLEGINTGTIAPQAIERGLAAIESLYVHIQEFACDRIIAIGTSALRNAHNADEFIQLVQQKFSFSISVISGNQEAEYIYLGNKLAYDWGAQTVLILDIGGGSNECIICNSDTILWKKSFENGMQRIANTIALSYPFTSKILSEIHSFLSETFAELHTACTMYNIDVLVGSSGPFDTFRDLVLEQCMLNTIAETFFEFSQSDLLRIHTALVTASKLEISKMPGMDSARIELLPIASCITQYMISEFSISHVVQSKYSLKEGVIQTFLQ